MGFRAWSVAAALCAVAFGAAAESAAEWPSRPVKVVVPYSPGGTADTLGRLISQHLQSVYKQSFIVDNRAGGGGIIGSQQVAKAAPDGYTLVVSGIGSHVIAPVETKAFNPLTDFTHIALLGGPPLVLTVHPSLGVANLKQLVAQVQRGKDGLSWGSPGQGTHGHLVGELFAQAAHISQTHIAYKGAGPALTDLLAGQIPAALTTLTSANAHIASGKIVGIALTAEHRLPEYPNVPTFAEQGYPILTAITWFSISGPAGMAPDLVAKINAEVRRGLATEALRRQFVLESIQTKDLDAAAFTRYVGSEIARWQPLVRSLDKPKVP